MWFDPHWHARDWEESHKETVAHLLEKAAHAFLLKLDAERAHSFGKWAMKKGFFAPGRYCTDQSRTELFGIPLDNPLGLAAGFDKNGELADVVQQYGFAYVEVGSITFHGGAGNPKPRLFRLRNGNLLNRMGLNGDPAEVVVQRLLSAQNPYAINIAKTHNPEIVGDKAIEDIVQSYNLVTTHLEPTGKLLYCALNLSCPNTKEGKTFEEPKALEELLSAVSKVRCSRPLLLKLSPTLSFREVYHVLEAAEPFADGYICSNTLPFEHAQYGRGELSGNFLREHTQRLLSNLRNQTEKPIIACGGIQQGADAYAAYCAGGQAGFQAYTGFALQGPKFAKNLLDEYFAIRKGSHEVRRDVIMGRRRKQQER